MDTHALLMEEGEDFREWTLMRCWRRGARSDVLARRECQRGSVSPKTRDVLEERVSESLQALTIKYPNSKLTYYR